MEAGDLKFTTLGPVKHLRLLKKNHVKTHFSPSLLFDSDREHVTKTTVRVTLDWTLGHGDLFGIQIFKKKEKLTSTCAHGIGIWDSHIHARIFLTRRLDPGTTTEAWVKPATATATLTPNHISTLRQINAAFPMRTVQNLEPDAKMNFPVVIRKGRNTLSMVCGHKDGIKKFFTTCNDAFLSQLEAHTLTRPTNPVCTWQHPYLILLVYFVDFLEEQKNNLFHSGHYVIAQVSFEDQRQLWLWGSWSCCSCCRDEGEDARAIPFEMEGGQTHLKSLPHNISPPALPKEMKSTSQLRATNMVMFVLSFLSATTLGLSTRQLTMTRWWQWQVQDMTWIFGRPGSNIRKKHCQDTTLLDEEKLEVHAKKLNMEKGLKDICSLHLCGSKQGVAYCGVENCSLPSVRLQAPWLFCCS